MRVFVGGLVLFEAAEFFEGCGELPIVAGDDPVHILRVVGIGGEGTQGEMGAGRGVIGGVGGRLPVDFEIDGGGVHGDEPHLTPAGGDEDIDQAVFDGVARLVTVVEGGEQGAEAFGRFAAYEETFGEHAVARIVERGDEFALRGPGAGGFERVEAIGGDLLFGCHLNFVLHNEKTRPWEPRLPGISRLILS
ncbi:MAG: hypothetical protein ABSB15_11135 [Bryobacteraceae bacterium]